MCNHCVLIRLISFNTSLPPLSEDERRQLEDAEPKDNHVKPVAGPAGAEHAAFNGETEVYDFSALQEGLGATYNDDDEEYDDHLGDMLVEENDDLNDDTFGDAAEVADGKAQRS